MSTPTKYRVSTISLDTPEGLAIDTDRNRLLICDYGNNRIVLSRIDWMDIYDTLGTYDGNTIGAQGACYYDGYFYVCDTDNHALVRVRARDLSFKDYFGTPGTSGSSTSTLKNPKGVTTDGQYLYICDRGNARIMKLDRETLSYDSQSSSINGSLSTPYGIVYKKEGGEALFISDKSGARIIKCKTDFTYIEQNSADLTSPQHLAFKDDYLYVADGDTILILASNGLSSPINYTDSTLDTSDGLAIYRDALFISDNVNDTINIWRIYNPRDSFTASTPLKFGGKFFDNPFAIVDVDTVTVGATQEYNANRWKEENSNNYGMSWAEESAVTTDSTEETAITSTWTEES